MAKTFEEIIAIAETIRTNTLPDSNSANMVGQNLKDIIQKSQEISDNKIDKSNISQVKGTSLELIMSQKAVSDLFNTVLTLATTTSNLIHSIVDNGFHVADDNGNVVLRYNDDGLDAAKLSTHFQGLVNSLITTLITSARGTTLAPLVNSLIPATYLPSFVDDVIDIDIFGTTAIAQYCSDNDGNTSTLSDKFCYDDENKIFQLAKQVGTTIDLIEKGSPESGKIYIDVNTNKSYRWSGTTMAEISNSIALGETANTAYAGDKGKLNETNIASLFSSLATLTTNNASAHSVFSAAITTLQSLIRQITENGFNIVDGNGNIGMKYDENGLDAALLSSHFQGLINALISTLITAAKGSSIAPLVNSLIPATYLPSFVDDVIDIDIFGTTAIAQYCSDNDGNTSTLSDKFCYDDENKIFQLAKQVGTTIDLIEKGSPESGKIYIDVNTNKSYRWSGTIMSEISNSISLGETANTAYAGDKGKQNADNLSHQLTLITAISAIVTTLSSIVTQISENGYYISDASGNVAMKYDASGFDVALLSDHIKSLIRQIDGIAGGVQLGETTGTAYDGGKGSALNILVNKLNLAVNTLKSLINSCNEDGYYVTDSDGNVVMKYTLLGLDVAEVSTHLQALLAEYFATKDEYSMLSTNLYDGLLSIYHDRKVRLALPSTAKILLYGDSISSTDYTWYKEWMQYYSGLSDVYNGGFSGRTAAYIASDAALARIFNYDPDVIIFQTGGNDVGDVVGTFGAVPSETTVSETDISVDYNGTYFIQAVSHIIRKVKAHYYNIVTRAALTGTETASEKIAKINAVKKPYIAFMTPTPQKRSGGSLSWSSEANWIRKRNAIVECCNKYNIHCIDIYSLWGVDMSLEPEWSSPTDQINQNGIYTMDGLHPSQAGYQRISELISGEINITIKS